MEIKIREKNIKVINNGLDASEFIPMPEIERKKNRLITTASADVPLKGLDYSLMAIKALKKDFKDIELIIVGKIKKNGHTERLIKDLNINKSVSFRSELTKKEIAKLYASSSIAIVSSLYEGFGYPVIEAMSCEVPLIATNVSSIPELVGSYASLIEPKSYDEIYKAVKQILLNYDEYERIAVGGRQHIINTFNWSKITTQYEDIITKTIKEHEKC